MDVYVDSQCITQHQQMACRWAILVRSEGIGVRNNAIESPFLSLRSCQRGIPDTKVEMPFNPNISLQLLLEMDVFISMVV